jgi:tetratricopeptide (TPR) repeat protein
MSIFKEYIDDYKSYSDQASVYEKAGYYDKAIENLEIALQSVLMACNASRDVSCKDNNRILAHIILAATLVRFGNIYSKKEEFDKSIYCHKKVVQIVKAVDDSKLPLGKLLKSFLELREGNDVKLFGAIADRTVELGKIYPNKTIEERGEILYNFESNISDKDKVFNTIKKAETSFFGASNDSSCFIATAVYSTSSHPDLDTFRQFRDTKLLTNQLGRMFVRWYYRNAPKFTSYIDKNSSLKSFLKLKLSYFAVWLRSHVLN